MKPELRELLLVKASCASRADVVACDDGGGGDQTDGDCVAACCARLYARPRRREGGRRAVDEDLRAAGEASPCLRDKGGGAARL